MPIAGLRFYELFYAAPADSIVLVAIVLLTLQVLTRVGLSVCLSVWLLACHFSACLPICVSVLLRPVWLDLVILTPYQGYLHAVVFGSDLRPIRSLMRRVDGMVRVTEGCRMLAGTHEQCAGSSIAPRPAPRR